MSFQRYRSHNIIRPNGNSAFRGDGSISSILSSSDSSSRSGPPQHGRRTLRDALATSQSLANSPSNDVYVPGNYSPRYRRHNGNESLTFLSSGDAVSTSPSRLDVLSESHDVVSDNGSARDLFVNSISNLLGSEQLSSLEQLEELMLMEAIRLSMSDVSMPPAVTSFAPILSDEQAASDISIYAETSSATINSNMKSPADVEHSHMEMETNNHCKEDFCGPSTSVIAMESTNGCNDDDEEEHDGIAFDNLKIRFKKSGTGIMHSRNNSGSSGITHESIARRNCDSPVISPSTQHVPVTIFGKISAEEEPKGEHEGRSTVGGLRHSTPYTSREHISGICTPQIWDTLEPQKEDHFSVDGSGSGSWDYSHDEAVNSNNNGTSKSAPLLNFDLKDKDDCENDVVRAEKFSRHGSASSSMDFSSSSSSLLEKIQLALDSPSASSRSEGRSLFRRDDAGGKSSTSRSGSIGYSVVTPENHLSSGTSLVFYKEDLQLAEEAGEELQK